MPPESPAPVQSGETERQALLEQALVRQEKLADSELEMARMFLVRGRPEIARRRLRKLLADYQAASVAPIARGLLASLE
jgi:outer membrane protein assembly factor BamD (BamD/ComL family)